MPRHLHPARPPRPGSLATYRDKRAAGKTPEPFGRPGSDRPGLFVVQQHDARNLHWDLRLEIGGVLRSWAVPKGPSLSTADKRLAVATEDHPVEYADFEGVIPADNYGAGAMIVWDRGQWIDHLDAEEGLESGKLLFELKGYKLRGLWTLVRTKRNPKEWLLIKKPDAYATGEDAEAMGGESVLSGLTVEELATGGDRAAELRAELERLGARRRRLSAGDVKVMLAEARDAPFTKKGWLFELKYDGYRVVAGVEGGDGGGGGGGGAGGAGGGGSAPGGAGGRRARLVYRSGREATATFPDLARPLAALPYDSLVVDGEVVVLDDEARPSFQRLQQRALLTRRADVERAAVQLPAAYFVFDLLGFSGYDLRALPLATRKELLRRLLPKAGPVRYADHVAERGEALYAEVVRAAVEGVVAKRADAPYRGGRSPAWLKIRAERTGDFAVVGFTLPQGTRSGFGALHLGALAGGTMTYAGRVGTGFSGRRLEEIHARLLPTVRRDPPFAGEAPTGPEHRWVDPRLVAEVRYLEVTDEGLLRQPVFLRLRDDKRVEDCTREANPRGGGGGGAAAEPAAPEGIGPAAAAAIAEGDEPPPAPVVPPASETRPTVRLTRLDKVFWPADGLTKGDLLDYYREVAPYLLPFLAGRPVVLDRYPDGIDGKSFFQKNVPDYVPDWIRTESIWSEESGRETRYVVCDDLETLLYLVNMGTIPLHVWASRIDDLQAPDWSILDLDAKQAPFSSVIVVARAIHALCRDIDLPAFVKTSGATGLHVLVPLGGRCTFEQARQLAELIGRVVVAELPKLVTLTRAVASREGRVYLDYLQNGYGKLLVAPYSVRPLPGAPVSTPLTWREVGPRLDPKSFTIKTAPKRFRRRKGDPLAPVLTTRPDLARALGRLAERV